MLVVCWVQRLFPLCAWRVIDGFVSCFITFTQPWREWQFKILRCFDNQKNPFPRHGGKVNHGFNDYPFSLFPFFVCLAVRATKYVFHFDLSFYGLNFSEENRTSTCCSVWFLFLHFLFTLLFNWQFSFFLKSFPYYSNFIILFLKH